MVKFYVKNGRVIYVGYAQEGRKWDMRRKEEQTK